MIALVMAGCKGMEPEQMVPVETCKSMPVCRAAATCFADGEKAYLLTGRDEKDKPQSDMYVYDAAADQWSASIQTPLSARVNATSCVCEGKAYVGLGFNGRYNHSEGYLRDWWEYDIEHNTWRELAPYPNHRTDKAVSLAGKGYIYVGYGFENGYTRDMFRYDIAENRWDSVDVHVAFMGYPLRSFGGTGASIQGRHFFGTGFRRKSMDWWAEFDEAGQWIERKPVPGGGRTTAAAAADDRYVYVIGGHHVGGVGTTDEVRRDIQRYDYRTDSWKHIGQMPEGRLNHVAFRIGRHIYVSGGDNEEWKATNTLWRIEGWAEE